MDPDPDIVNTFLVASEEVMDQDKALDKVIAKIKESGEPSYYKYEIRSTNLVKITLAQALEVLNAVGGLKVVE